MIRGGFGFKVRDEILIETVRRLEKRLRQIDTLSRIGEDKFALLLENIKRFSDVSLVIDRIQQELLSPFRINGLKLDLTVDIGVAYSTQPYKVAEDFLQVGEIAFSSSVDI
jgi:diguanylate cyclase (GGDEF)-like protein